MRVEPGSWGPTWLWNRATATLWYWVHQCVYRTTPQPLHTTHRTHTRFTTAAHAHIPHAPHTKPQTSPHATQARTTLYTPTHLALCFPLPHMSVRIWRGPRHPPAFVTSSRPTGDALWLCGWVWLSVLRVGLKETILGTRCGCTSVSQLFFFFFFL